VGSNPTLSARPAYPRVNSNRLVWLVGRARNALREQGARQFMIMSANWIRARCGFQSAEQTRYLDNKSATDAAFDSAAGVRTGGVQSLYGLTIKSENARFGTTHIASDPGEFKRAMERIDFDLTDATFIDLGSGRGRALLMAAMLPFKKVIGVEFAQELHQDSVENIRTSTHDLGRRDRITPILGDATQFEFPDGPLILYLYNPFDAPIVAAVARNAIAAWRALPRPMRVIYINPVFGGEWQQAGWQLLEAGEGRAVYSPPEAP
jgi:SAM-dependent methyltransferase